MATEDTATSDTHPHRIRLIIDTEEELREAVRQRARKLSVKHRREVSNSEVVNEILRSALREEIEEGRGDQSKSRRKGK